MPRIRIATFFEAETEEEDDIKRMCTKSGGCGIHLSFPQGGAPLFKFHTFLDNPKLIQLWSVNDTRRYVPSTYALSREEFVFYNSNGR